MRPILIGMYFTALIGHIVLRETEIFPILRTVSKGALMPMLFIYTFQFAPKTKLKKWVLFGIAFSWVGDMLLAFDNQLPILFVFGLSAFLIAHIGYILGFASDAPVNYPIRMTFNQWILIVIVLAFAISYFLFLQPLLGNLAIPVIAYVMAISCMALFAIHRGLKSNQLSYLNILLGAFLFLASDSLLAFNKFVNPLPFATLFIMATYGLAQFYIARGTVRNEKH